VRGPAGSAPGRGRRARAAELGPRVCAAGEGAGRAAYRSQRQNPAQDRRGGAPRRERAGEVSSARCGVGVSAHRPDREDLPLAHRLLPGEALRKFFLIPPSSSEFSNLPRAPFPSSHSGTFPGNAFGFGTLLGTAQGYPEVIFSLVMN
jgi:hypothetical protein